MGYKESTYKSKESKLMPYMDEDLKEHRLLAILDVLLEADDKPLSVAQIQYRLGANRNLNMSREEIEAHLRWGQNQPNATQAPVKPVQQTIPHPKMPGRSVKFRGWTVEAKQPLTPEEHKVAGSPPWLYKV